MRCVLSGLKRFELTEAETQVVSIAEQYLNQNDSWAEKIEPILECIYHQKTKFIRDSVLSMIKQEKEQRYS